MLGVLKWDGIRISGDFNMYFDKFLTCRICLRNYHALMYVIILESYNRDSMAPEIHCMNPRFKYVLFSPTLKIGTKMSRTYKSPFCEDNHKSLRNSQPYTRSSIPFYRKIRSTSTSFQHVVHSESLHKVEAGYLS